MKVRKNLTFDESTVARVELYADQRGISLSAAFSVLANSILNMQDKVKSEEGVQLIKDWEQAVSDRDIALTELDNAIERILQI